MLDRVPTQTRYLVALYPYSACCSGVLWCGVRRSYVAAADHRYVTDRDWAWAGGHVPPSRENLISRMVKDERRLSQKKDLVGCDLRPNRRQDERSSTMPYF